MKATIKFEKKDCFLEKKNRIGRDPVKYEIPKEKEKEKYKKKRNLKVQIFLRFEYVFLQSSVYFVVFITRLQK